MAVVLLKSSGEGAVFEVISRYPSDSEAHQSVQRVREALNTCGELVSTDGVARTEWHIVDAPLREFGDESLAILGTRRSEGTAEDVQSYLVLIRRRNLLAFIDDETSTEPDRAATEALVAKADAKFAQAAADAP